jgi:UDP-2,4-diacetamido-2,4,6-trideoxy-beta-L-altropyranose hydrolase
MKGLVVAIRADFSAQIGLGHAKRCLALARALCASGAKVFFVYRDLGIGDALFGAEIGVIRIILPAPAKSFTPASNDVEHARLAGVPWRQDAEETIKELGGAPLDWVVVDHYAFDARWHEAVESGLNARIAVIDDLGDRELSTTILIDHNYSLEHRKKYSSRLGPKTERCFFGPRFALLSPAYASAPRYAFNRSVESIGIFMGGSDIDNVSSTALQACRSYAKFQGHVEIATTSANPNLHSLNLSCGTHSGAKLTVDLPDLSSFFARHDLQIGAGGGATWERACIGAPTLALCIANNQELAIRELATQGILATTKSLVASAIGHDISALIVDSEKRKMMAERSRELVDGRGAQRIATYLSAATLGLRNANSDDAVMMYSWRNDPRTREVSSNSLEFTFEEHVTWLHQTLLDCDHILLIGMIGEYSVGVIRFDKLSVANYEVSIYLDPALHGLRLGSQLLLKGESTLISRLGSNALVHATVIDGNRSSERLFREAGYRKIAGKWSKSCVS